MKVHIVLNIGGHYVISSAIRKIEKRKTVYALTFGDFVLPEGVNICSVNLDRETIFLTLSIGTPVSQCLP